MLGEAVKVSFEKKDLAFSKQIQMKIMMPPEDPDGIPTLNKMGYMTTSLDIYAKEFVSYASTCKSEVLEIGSAYGIASLEVLAKGGKVVSNDLDCNHIKILEERCPPEYKDNLTTKVGNFLDMDFPNDHFGAVLAARVIHFMNGEDVRKTLSCCYNIMKKGGKLFLVSDTPYQQDSKKFIPVFEKRLQNQEDWPGLVDDISSIGSPSVSNLPKLFHFFDPNTLRRELEYANFHVEKISYFSREDYSDSSRLDGREEVGAIAIKL